MATLHVRNVPEPIYELLRDCADAEGRSIGAQAIVFIQQGVWPRAAQRRLPRQRSGMQRFTAGAREAVVRAQDEARALRASEVLPGHIVLGLLAAEGPARAALDELDVDPDAIRSSLPSGTKTPRRLKFAPPAKEVLEQALRESLALRHDYIGAEHLLLALEGDPLLEGQNVRAAVTLALAHPPGAFEMRPLTECPEYLAVDLDGPADNWTERLNELAGDGWELMQVVDHRAVLRRA